MVRRREKNANFQVRGDDEAVLVALLIWLHPLVIKNDVFSAENHHNS
jgi:hypothetical protein